MTNNEKKLPKATMEIIKEYEEVYNECSGLDPSWTDEELKVLDRLYELENNYDWSNIEFTDPVTGKIGLKNVKGELMAPALYDAFPNPGTFIDPWDPIAAILDGKYGLLDGKGHAEVLVPFEYDDIDSAYKRWHDPDSVIDFPDDILP